MNPKHLHKRGEVRARMNKLSIFENITPLTQCENKIPLIENEFSDHCNHYWKIELTNGTGTFFYCTKCLTQACRYERNGGLIVEVRKVYWRK